MLLRQHSACESLIILCRCTCKENHEIQYFSNKNDIASKKFGLNILSMSMSMSPGGAEQHWLASRGLVVGTGKLVKFSCFLFSSSGLPGGAEQHWLASWGLVVGSGKLVKFSSFFF